MGTGSAGFVRSFFMVTALLIVWNVLFNLAVDPYGVYGGYPGELFREIQIEGGSRVGKAELARRFTGTTALVGSSRVEVGYDPQSAAIPDGPACNLGISGTNFHELSYVLDFILTNPNFRRIVLCLDFQQFTDGRTTNYDFELSRFNPQLSLFDYHCNLLLRNDVTRASLKTLKMHFGGEHGEVTPLGFRRPAAMATERSLADRAAKKLRDAASSRETLAGYRYSAERLEDLERIARKCHSSNRELIVVIHPVHATMLELMHCMGLWTEYELWLTDVVQIVADASQGEAEVWDFTGFDPYASEPLLTAGEADSQAGRWFWEPSHCKAQLGEEILRRIFDRPDADRRFGRRLDAQGLPEHFARVRDARGDWLRQHPGEAKSVRQLALEAGQKLESAVAARGSETSFR